MKSILLISGFLSFIYINAQKAIISTPNTVVVYIGLQNPVDVSYPGVAPTDLVIKENRNCEISRNGDQYFVKPHPNTSSCSFIIGIKTGRAIKWVDTAIVPVRNIPKGEVRLGELSNGNYGLQEISLQTKLTYHTNAYFKDFEKNVTFTQFRIVLVPKKGPLETMSFSGAAISKQMKEFIGRLKGGDILIIDDIRVNIYDKEFLLSPLTITIADEYHTDSSANDSGFELTVELDSLNDSTFRYESFFADGKKYQQGQVLTESKFRRYTYSELYGKEPYEKHLLKIPKGYYPIGEWDIFDSVGHHIISINYMAMPDTIFIHQQNTAKDSNSEKYRIVPHGQCIFYKSDGIIERIIYYNRGIIR